MVKNNSGKFSFKRPTLPIDLAVIPAGEKMYQLFFLFVVFGNLLFSDVLGHGRLIEPPSRASMWRYGFDTPHDYNDNELYCGGYTRQWQRNKGKCGICGDPWDVKLPRQHESGGKYANGIIVRKYRTASMIPIQIELTANHQGYFEFRLCPMTHRGVEVSDECLNKHLLVGEDGSARYYPGPGNRIFENQYKLPDDLTCIQCVLQWRYIAGNNWGDCGNGTSAVGCGPQEEFRACADISIGDNEATLPPRPSTPKMEVPPREISHILYPSSSTESTLVPETTGPYWLFSLIIVVTCLLVVLAALALLYTYYYHAGRAKKWLMAGKLLAPESSPPVAPPRQKKQQSLVLHLPIDP